MVGEYKRVDKDVQGTAQGVKGSEEMKGDTVGCFSCGAPTFARARDKVK